MIDTFLVLLVLVGTVYPSNPEQGEHSICFEKKVAKMRWNYCVTRAPLLYFIRS